MDTLLGTARPGGRIHDARPALVHGAPPRRRPTGSIPHQIPRAQLTRRIQIRLGLPPSRLDNAQNGHDCARRPAPARRVSPLLKRSVAVFRRRDQHQRRVFGVCDALAGG